MNLKNSFHSIIFFSDTPVRGAVIAEGKSSSSISPLLNVSYMNFLIGPILSLRVANASYALILMVRWVSAVSHALRPCKTWGNIGHWHPCFPHQGSAWEESTHREALNSLHTCKGGADRNELFKNWQLMLPVIFRVHHFILAGFCFTMGKYFHSHLPLKNVRFFQNLQ